jgi:quinol monooxygenase YgiN
MAIFIEMDDKVTLRAQLASEAGPVIVINKFNAMPEEVNQLLDAWAADAAFMKAQPGFISTQLHRGIASSCVLVNYAVWESVKDLKRALTHREFQEQIYPPSVTVSAHLFQKVAVAGICVG